MSLVGLLSALAGFVKIRFLADKEVIDNVIFRCHYRFTSAILFVCCILCTANSLIGNPIECLNSQFKDKIHVINTFCWITSTYTIPHLQGQQVGTHVAGPGVGPHVQGLDEVQHHNYYQWVPFVLFLQGLLFYVPHWLWKNWEGGKIKMISKDLRGSTIECKEKRHNKQDKLVQYISYSLHTHNGYAFGYFFCEILNFVNVVGNIFFIDKFLGNTFLSYGIKVIQMSSNDDLHRTDPMIAIFPRLTKCLFRTYGASGTIQTHDALCVLPLNILNEKIFIFLWFWFIILAALSGLALIYSIVIAMYPPIRETILIRLFKYRPPGGVDRIVTKIQVGDFLLLHLLGQNLCSSVFRELLIEVSTLLSTSNLYPTLPSSLEMAPISQKDKYIKDPDA
ncbi:innexin inx3-like [Zootermopsis nevadensis]|uniref:innexin inx3-like n=1 Tax=Zootermopsis nevadensis TaxID=136037 RepID=UPI000B8E4C24|nr:innexin inx3-like [Zootermopsis nevadensis]XP_021925146.1 innexin inx3-like [Zootermopsis nevadensis]XP_021925147.1 innexin inx3-like [Zootermopsis nevadensis]